MAHKARKPPLFMDAFWTAGERSEASLEKMNSIERRYQKKREQRARRGETNGL